MLFVGAKDLIPLELISCRSAIKVVEESGQWQYENCLEGQCDAALYSSHRYL